MTSQWIIPVFGTAVIVCGLIAGVFLSFSDFIMKSLSAGTPVCGIESMQIINRKVYHSLFLILLLGMAAASLALVVCALLIPLNGVSSWIILGSMVYLIGVFLVTVVFNVPMNKRLDMLDHSALETADYWKTYTSSWTAWNHVRTLSSTVAAVCFLVASLSL